MKERAGIPFTKMHGLGNDYLYIDVRQGLTLPWEEVARQMSDRHFGVGSDGIILIASSSVAPVRMRIFNADGSESEMCGNGLRALAKWLFDRGELGKSQRIETGAGVLEPEVVETDVSGRARRIRVNMGEPRLTRAALGMRQGDPNAWVQDVPLPVDGEAAPLVFTGVSMGNPHAVFFGPLWDAETVQRLGPAIERHPWFPSRINVHSVRVDNPRHLTIRHWERGSGVTLACGTGAAASLVAAASTGRAERSVVMTLPGGDLEGEWDAASNAVYLTGPAQEVCQGTFALG